MSKKSYNDIEAEIRQLAEAYEAPFDEQAWVKMEALLDKDKGKKRRPFFWLWWTLPLLVAVTVGGLYFLKQPSTENKSFASGKLITDSKAGDKVASNVNAAGTVVPVSGTEVAGNSKKTSVETDNLSDVESNHPATGQKQSGADQPIVREVENRVAGSTAVQVKKKRKAGTGSRMKMKVEQPTGDGASMADAGKKQVVYGNGEMQVDKDNNKPAGETDADKNIITEQPVAKSEIDSVAPEKLSKTVTVNEKTTSDTVKKDIVKTKKKTQRGLYFIAAAGAEASGVKLFSFDKFTARYGVGIGYQVTKNWSVQAGFYAGNKKYIAGPGDYKAKEGSYWSRVDITKVDAVCRVYEIPLLLRYDFSPGKNTNLFLSAGISSFIMKKEDYHYYYYRYGMPYDAEAYYSGNKHLFSVLRIAPGLQTKLKGSFALNVSPGIAIPLAGVGEGSVKLYSTDLTIGLKFTPKRKK